MAGAYYECVEHTIAKVKTTRRLFARSMKEAKRRFDEGDWESIAEEVGDVESVVSTEIKKVERK